MAGRFWGSDRFKAKVTVAQPDDIAGPQGEGKYLHVVDKGAVGRIGINDGAAGFVALKAGVPPGYFFVWQGNIVIF